MKGDTFVAIYGYYIGNELVCHTYMSIKTTFALVASVADEHRSPLYCQIGTEWPRSARENMP